MIKQILVSVLVIVLCMVPGYEVFAGQKDASAKAYEHASEQSIFNRASDWFATVGKSAEEKQVILAERKAARAAQHAARKAERAGQEMKKKMGKEGSHSK